MKWDGSSGLAFWSKVNELSTLDEDDTPRALWERAVGWGIVAICIIIVLQIVNPGMKLWPFWDIHRGDLFLNTTTNGGDMGAHVWWPRFLAEQLVPEGAAVGLGA